MTDVRAANPTDLPDILAMIRALSAFHGDTAKATLAQLQTTFFGPEPIGTALIATSDGTSVGYAGLTKTTVLHSGDIRLDIQHLYVTDGLRGQGIGTALINAAQLLARDTGAARLTIGTNATNTTAIAAYRAMPILFEITDAGPRFHVRLD